MRILWFSVTPSLFNPKSNNHNGGGWIASLEQIIRKEPTVDLGIAFDFHNSDFKYERERVVYYPIPNMRPSLLQRLFGKNYKNKFIDYCLHIIDDFKPDIIQIFGSENDFGLLSQYTKIPIIIHMQGCLPPYHNALFPVGMNKFDFIFSRSLSLNYRWLGFRSESSFRNRAEQEIRTIQSCNYFMGRTEWDKGLVSLFNPNATYFHCEEALRDSFINKSNHWSWPERNKLRIISVISNPWYKGMDLILKTSNLLKRFTTFDFEWFVYGVQNIRLFEQKYDINSDDVNVKIMGIASKDELIKALCSSTLYVHPSYIDNSPNSICEAQFIGVPVLATNVGGISSIVRDGETGILFPANAPYTLANRIIQLSTDPEKCLSLSRAAIAQATVRHNPHRILETLLNIYQTILSDVKGNS